MVAKKLEQKPKGEGIPTTAKVSPSRGRSQGPHREGPLRAPCSPGALGCWGAGGGRRGAVCLGISQLRAAPSQGTLCTEDTDAPIQEPDFL